MKELSENVKAIDVVRQMVADGQVSKDVAEKYFPELKDSEDETIRKVLIQYFSTFRLGTFAGIEPKKIIDWLEKQGEQKPILDVEIPFGAKDSELEEVFYSIPNGFHAEIEDDKVVIKKGEQKYWSEVDNFMYNKIKNLLTDISLAPEAINSLFDWLKDLKDRIQPQTTWKPSDDQMKYLKRVVEDWKTTECKYQPLETLYNDLKKLRNE